VRLSGKKVYKLRGGCRILECGGQRIGQVKSVKFKSSYFTELIQVHKAIADYISFAFFSDDIAIVFHFTTAS